MDNQGSTTGNPAEKNRRLTDKFCIFIFPLILFVWLGICIAGFAASPINDISILKHVNILNQYVVFYKNHARPSTTSLTVRGFMTAMCSCMGIYLYLFLVEKKTKLFVLIGLAFSLLVAIVATIMAIFKIIEYVSDIFGGLSYWPEILLAVLFMIFNWLEGIHQVVCCVSFFKTDNNILVDITKDSCGAIHHCPLVVTFMSSIFLLVMSVIYFSSEALIFYFESGHDGIFDDFFGSLIILDCVYIIVFIGHYAIMVMSAYTINYYWEKDENSSHMLGRTIVNTMKYHTGTIMFGSTIFISFICRVVKAFKHKKSRNSKEHSIFYIVCKIYLMITSKTSLIFTSIYGTDYLKSVQNQFYVTLRRSSLFLATQALFSAIFVMVPVIIWTICLTLALAIAPVKGYAEKETEIKVMNIMVATYIPLLIIMAGVKIITDSLSINQIIISNRRDPED